MRCRIWAVMLLCVLSLPLWSQEKRVTIELKDAPIAEAFDQLFRAVGENFVLEPGVPAERRLTMRLVDIPFEKALNFLCDLAGLKWEKKDSVYVVSSKTGFFTFPPSETPLRMPVPAPPIWGPSPAPLMPEKPVSVPPMIAGSVGVARMTILPPPSEQRCPRCGTVIRRDCPQCKRPMPPDWRFCPYDGKELPPVPQKCPKCGAALIPMRPPLPPQKPSPPPAGASELETFELEPPAILPRTFGLGELFGSYYLRVMDEDAVLFVVPKEEVIVHVFEDGKVLAERKLPPRNNLIRLSEILGKKPVPAGTYRFLITKEGQKIAELSFVVQR